MNKFIVLEGLDGVGKTTLAKGLAKELDGEYMSTPGEPFSDCRRFIIDAMGDDQLGRALFYASTVSVQGKRALEQVSSGRCVIMDRYWGSTVAYAKARGVEVDLEALTPGLVMPDLVVLITLDEEVRRSRLLQRKISSEDEETLCTDFTRHVISELAPRCQLRVNITGLHEKAAIEHLAIVIRAYFKEAKMCSGEQLLSCGL